MEKHVSSYVALLILMLCIGVRLNAKESEPPKYVSYVREIVKAFSLEMEKDYGLICMGSGGSMPKDVETIEVPFIAFRTAHIDEVRVIEVTAVQKLLNLINSHDKIRPFLREYPFKHNRVDVSISFRTSEDERPLDGSVALVFLARDQIFYRSAELRKGLTMPFSDCRDPNNIIVFPQKEVIEEVLVPILDESFEAAEKIVKSSSKSI
jgi:hypothetical protein